MSAPSSAPSDTTTARTESSATSGSTSASTSGNTSGGTGGTGADTPPPAGLRTRLAPLARLPRWSVLPACAALGALAGGTYGLLQTPEYTATSYVVAVPGAKADPATALGFAQAYGRVATQLAVLGDAQVAAGISPTELQDRVKVATSPDAPMIAVSASADRPGDAATLANAVSRALTASAGHTKDSTRVKLLPFSRAVAPAAPSSLSASVTALVGLCAGGLLGGLGLLVRPRAAAGALPGGAVPGPASAEDRGGA
ncbi:lipopolysaccharide biosynthesis protein [Streptomyces flavofungini]|uniref:lipopolysaccharide biosynthesis protein n=1 Tax=Streptomyces flavofungini TaxID=68200 RepID=UPI0025AFA998|nr:lipopolysaccharide biosynthesis protein [Streptomyces flavofungini]WJV47500.1 lipopolysaccharide biosynthesis protein [Streptomyces flavofungini]